jgi:hypothetical protein
MDRSTTRPRDNERKPYCLYTRYPEGIAGSYAEDLMCPKCGAEEIVITKESEFGAKGMMGDEAQCWICKHEFTITENCWKGRNKEPWGKDPEKWGSR